MITNRSAGRLGRQPSIRGGSDISATELFGLCPGLCYRWVQSVLLRAHLRSLERLADYFAWQQENGAAGLADTQKRIAMAKSDLQRLQ